MNPCEVTVHAQKKKKKRGRKRGRGKRGMQTVPQSKCDGSLVILEIVTIFHLLLLLESDFHIFFKLHEIYEKF